MDGRKEPVAKNQHRRHMTPSQLAIVAGKATELLAKTKADAEQRMRSGKKPDPRVTVPQGSGQSRDAIGKLLGVSGSLVERGTKVVAKGEPELIAAVEQGRMSITTAAFARFCGHLAKTYQKTAKAVPAPVNQRLSIVLPQLVYLRTERRK